MSPKIILLLAALTLLLTTACAFTLYGTPTPTPTALPTVTPLPPSPTPVPPTATATSIVATVVPSAPVTRPAGVTPVSPAAFCADTQVTTLLNSFKSAVQGSNGALLASLVSPVHGMDVRYYRYGRVVNYDVEHAKFVFVSTFQVNWGPAPGSGLDTKGSFHEVIIPALLDVLNKNYTLTCNQVQVGGTTYQAVWPPEYANVNFYSMYFPGTEQYGSLDWHTWLVGVEYVGGKPYLYALMQFQWEP